MRANAQAIREHVTAALNEARTGVVTASLVEHGADAIARVYDVRYGGFGTAPKFPHPGALELLLARWWDTRADWPRNNFV